MDVSFWNQKFHKTRNQTAKSYWLSDISAENLLIILRTDYILCAVQAVRTRSSYNPGTSQLCFKRWKMPSETETWWASSIYYLLHPPALSLWIALCNMTHVSLRAGVQFQQIKQSMTSKKVTKVKQDRASSRLRPSPHTAPLSETHKWGLIVIMLPQ